MAMGASKMFVEGVEFQRMGQNLTLARYPIHWHLIGDAKGQYIRNAAIHDTYNRCVTVHGTNFLRVENNVTYNTVGHCFFLEDGIEHGNEYVTTWRSRPSVIRPSPASRRDSLQPERAQTSTIARPSERKARPPRMSCCPRTTRRRVLDHQSGQHLPRQRGCGFRRERLLDVIAGAPERASSKARRSARPPGRVERPSASSRATSPTPTTTRSCSTGTSTPTTRSV
jgi:hypothetical protein